MKSKALLIAAAALAAGVMSSQAQVYSQNIVGYINVPLQPGYNLVANQLDLDGTGTNNSINTVVGIGTLPNLSKVLVWNGSTYLTTTYSATAQKWSLNSQAITNGVNPGSGFFIDIPGSAATNVTFVGNVITGTNTYPIAAGYQIIAPSGPVAGTLDGTNGYHPTKLDQILVWNGSTYVTHTYGGSSWSGAGGDPQLAVGQAVFYNSKVNTNWTQILNVQ